MAEKNLGFKHMRSAAFLRRADGSVEPLGEIKVERITETTEHIDLQSGVTVHLRRVVNGIVVYDGKPDPAVEAGEVSEQSS